jgi:phosphoglycerate dehydrogenase-like enzyme
MAKILITPRSLTKDPPPELDLLRQEGFELVLSTPGKQPDEDELIRLLPGVVGMLAGVEPITARVLSSAKELKVISRNGTGIDKIDLEACRQHGITVQRAEGANARGVAELAIALILDMARSISFSDARMKSGNWARRKGFELRGKTLGLIGCGRVGQEVALMAIGLGMQVRAYDPCPGTAFRIPSKFSFTGLGSLLKDADVISLHCPTQKNGAPIISDESLALMKEGVLLVNTARAELVDEEAVLKHLMAGRLAGYATDVFRHEPPDAAAIFSHERVITTPHIGGYTEESVERATRTTVQSLIDFFHEHSQTP